MTSGAGDNPAAWERIAELADQCVMCGLCLPHCPTYRVHRCESESPRGRIALAQALARGRLGDPQSAQAPLDHCLGCLSCEGVCPAKVHYGELISSTRALGPPSSKPSALWVRRLAATDWAVRVGGWTHRVWSSLGSPRWFLPGWLAALAVGVPPARSAPTSNLANAGSASGNRWLFTGCAAAAIDQPARSAAAELLAALGISVTTHPHTGCCGQMHRAAGDFDQSQRLAKRLAQRLDESGVTQLLSLGSGCHAQLCRATGGGRVADLGRFLDQLPALKQARFRPLPLRAELHLPCSQRSDVKDTQSWRSLLSRIPQLQLNVINSGPSCCGAAGTHCLEQPETAATLRNELIDGLDPAAELLLTTNPGCAMYLRAGLVQRSSPRRVVHPVQVLAEQLELEPTDE